MMNVRPNGGLVAPERSIHIRIFYQILPYVSNFARRGRMELLTRTMDLQPGTRVLDLGGSPGIWQHVLVPLNITLLNLPGGIPAFEFDPNNASAHTFNYVEGDACDVHQFPDRSFDLVFSNSVIEHVGPSNKQEQFAREVMRLGKSYWVQTPSIWFPIEAHTGLPFYWFFPERFRSFLLERSRRRLPAWWTEFIAGTRVLSRSRMVTLFPKARIRTEYFLGLPKSYTAYSRT
jgi:2-polyprenyl-3-methyl-5-hydroxy-6-metoxy-1,4-benzoquinol methylase